MKPLNWLAILLVFCLFASFAVVACGDDDDDDDDDDNDDSGGDDDDNGPLTTCWDDSTSGLYWFSIYNAIDYGYPVTWDEAVEYCANLTDCENSNWRIPTISELRTLVRECDKTETGGACGVTDDCLSYDNCYDEEVCSGCGYVGPGPNGACWEGPFNGGDEVWSQSLVEDQGDEENPYHWNMIFQNGQIYPGEEINKDDEYGDEPYSRYLLCVH